MDNELYTLRQKEEEIIKSNKKSVNILFAVACILIVFVTLITVVFFGVHVEGESMSNTLNDGDVLIASYIKEPDYGSIVAISGKKDNELIIKRIIGKPGDTISLENGKVYRTSKGGTKVELNEPYIKEPDSTYPTNYPNNVWVLDDDQYYFLGDNRKNSNDSRYYGTCSRKQIIGVIPDWCLRIKDFTTDAYYGFYWFMGPLINLFK